MFMVVAVEDKKEPLRQRLGRLLRGDALEWEERSCGGNRYRYVVWHGPAERLPWGRLALLCPRPRSPVLLPPEVLAPEGCPLRDYRPQDFTARLTVAAARQAMEQTAGKGSGLLGLLDPQGIAPWACGEWLDCCRSKGIYLAAKPLCCRGNHAAGGIRPAAAMGGDPSRAGGLFHLRGALSNRSDTGAAADNHCRPQWDTGEPHSEPADASTDAGTAGGGATGGGTNRLLGDGNGVRYPPGEAAADPWGMPH